MFAVTHRIGGITFRTEAALLIPRLEHEGHEKFRVREDAVPDVHHHIHKVPTDLLPSDPQTMDVRKQLSLIAQLEPEDVASPLLYTPLVRDRIHTAQDQRTQTYLDVKQNHVIVYDYAHKVLDLFYTEKYGGPRDERDIEERLRIADGSPVAERFQVHQIKSDSLTAPPLAAEDREHLVRIAEFSPRMIPKLPLLQSPAVRLALQPGIDGAEAMQVYIYLDGLMIWNSSRNRVEFFYPEGGGKSSSNAESRLGVDLRWLFAMFLPQFSAIMVHGSGLIHNHRAAVFLAPDAGGKTTTLEQAKGGPFLSDDQIILRKEGNDVVAHATPFGAMGSGPCQARLGALFALEKAPHFELQLMKPAEMVETYWPDPENPARRLPKPFKVQAFELFCDICHRVPVYRMRFPKDFVDWNAIDVAMA